MGNWNCCPSETDDGGHYTSPEGTRARPGGKVRRGQREAALAPLLQPQVTRPPLFQKAVHVDPITLQVSRIKSQEKNPDITTRKTAYTTWTNSEKKKYSSENKLWQVVKFTDELAEALFIKGQLWNRKMNDADKDVLQGGDAVVWEVSRITYRSNSPLAVSQESLDSTFQIPFTVEEFPEGDVEEFLVVSLIVEATDFQLYRYTINNGWKTFISRTAAINNQMVDQVEQVDVRVHGDTVRRYRVVQDNGSAAGGGPVKQAPTQKNMPAITSIRF
jgi:hypothetical protein